MPTSNPENRQQVRLQNKTFSKRAVAVAVMLSNAFRTHGHFCASHPWEVIVLMLTLTICMLSMGGILNEREDHCRWKESCNVKEDVKGTNAIVMTAMRCLALLVIYHQFRKLWKLGSKYVLGIAGLFAVFSSLVFSSSVVNFLKIDFAQLNEAWPFFLLLIDLSKASLLAQLALSSSSQKEVRENIARGMAVLGPTITLDTLVETLVIGVGTLSGVKQLEMICCFACMSAVVNYLVFMSFYPACLSLVLELSRELDEGRPVWQLTSLTRALHEEEQKPNPVIQRVKLIMSAGLVLVHAHSRWPIILERADVITEGGQDLNPALMNNKILELPEWTSHLDKWLSGSADQVVMLILAVALSVKYIFFESRESLPDSVFQQRSELAVTGVEEEISRKVLNSKAVQTDFIPDTPSPECCDEVSDEVFNEEPSLAQFPQRDLDQCLDILRHQKKPHLLTDDEVISLVSARLVSAYRLEWDLANPERGVAVRRKIYSAKCQRKSGFDKLPYTNYDYSLIMDACCENVVGYVPVPVGIVGPLNLDGENVYVPMATTEGCLIASTNRGCRALTLSGGVQSNVVFDGMTRGPAVKFPTAAKASEVLEWLNKDENFQRIKLSFDSTSRFARLDRLMVKVVARYLFIRFQAKTGDAMGMNMVSKGADISLQYLKKIFPDMEIVSLSGNFCTDKKPSALNWIEGRGKSVVCEAIIPEKVVKEVLKTSIIALIEKNISKNLVGSAVAGSIGGFNAQAANIVTAIYIATGQDPAQNVTSSNCITLMEANGPDLYVSVSMPSIEIGTVGGGTVLPPQAACLDLMGVKGPCAHNPGQHADKLARIVCGTVLAGELSLMSALASGDLVRSHLTHNRSQSSEDSTSVSKSYEVPDRNFKPAKTNPPESHI